MIKIKIGKCLDCTDGIKKPLTAKRCQTHYWHYRASLKPVKAKDIGKRIAKVSAKRKIENPIYTKERLRFLSQPENHRCIINGMPTTEIHHKYCGKDRAKHYLDTSTWLAVNRDSHNWIHENPKESRELGYLM